MRAPETRSKRGDLKSAIELEAALRLEVVPGSLRPPVTEYSLLLDGRVIGDLEWIGGRQPELHLQVGKWAGLVRLKGLRPFVLVGSLEAPTLQANGILHVGSAGEGLIEVAGTQFRRRTSPSGRLTVLDQSGTVVLTSEGSSGKRILAYDRTSSHLELPELLELTLVEAFCAIYSGRHVFRSMCTAWVRVPTMGVPLTSHPRVKALQSG